MKPLKKGDVVTLDVDRKSPPSILAKASGLFLIIRAGYDSDHDYMVCVADYNTGEFINSRSGEAKMPDSWFAWRFKRHEFLTAARKVLKNAKSA